MSDNLENKPLISIIIPIYHVTVSDTIREAVTANIAAVEAQTYPNKEIILAENGNDDDAGFCDAIAGRFSDVRVIHDDEKISVGAARQHAMDEARGEYLMFVDADDELPAPTVIDRMYERLSSEGADVLIGDYQRRMNGELIDAHPHGYSSDTDLRSGDFRFTGFFSGGTLSYIWCKLYRTAYIRENDIRVADIAFGEDKSFSMCLYASEPRYVFSDEKYYIYTANMASESQMYRMDYRENWIGASRHLEEYVKEHDKDPHYHDLSAYTILFSLIFHAKQEYSHTKKLSDIVSCVRGYCFDPYCLDRIRSIRKARYASDIKEFSYRLGVRGLSFLVTSGMIHLTAIGLYILFFFRVDKKHSSTGR